MTLGIEHVTVFDLDDTLYLERDYVASGFAAAGAWLAAERGIHGLGGAAWSCFESGHRGNIFDIALGHLGMTPDPALIACLVGVYRGHVPDIALAPDAAAWLSAPPPNRALALLTDGPVASQSAKIAALGLADHGLSPLVMTGTLGEGCGKPHPRGFCVIESAYGLSPDCFTYVADNAAKDFVTPRRRGWRTVQIRREGRLHQASPIDAEHAADRVITSLGEME